MDDRAQIWLGNIKEIANLAPQKQKYDWWALHAIYLQAPPGPWPWTVAFIKSSITVK